MAALCPEQGLTTLTQVTDQFSGITMRQLNLGVIHKSQTMQDPVKLAVRAWVLGPEGGQVDGCFGLLKPVRTGRGKLDQLIKTAYDPVPNLRKLTYLPANRAHLEILLLSSKLVLTSNPAHRRHRTMLDSTAFVRDQAVQGSQGLKNSLNLSRQGVSRSCQDRVENHGMTTAIGIKSPDKGT